MQTQTLAEKASKASCELTKFLQWPKRFANKTLRKEQAVQANWQNYLCKGVAATKLLRNLTMSHENLWRFAPMSTKQKSGTPK